MSDMNAPQIPARGSTIPTRRGASSVLYTLVGFVAGCVAMFGSLALLHADWRAKCSMSATVMSIDGAIEDGLGRPTLDPTLMSTEEPSRVDARYRGGKVMWQLANLNRSLQVVRGDG